MAQKMDTEPLDLTSKVNIDPPIMDFVTQGYDSSMDTPATTTTTTTTTSSGMFTSGTTTTSAPIMSTIPLSLSDHSSPTSHSANETVIRNKKTNQPRPSSTPNPNLNPRPKAKRKRHESGKSIFSLSSTSSEDDQPQPPPPPIALQDSTFFPRIRQALLQLRLDESFQASTHPRKRTVEIQTYTLNDYRKVKDYLINQKYNFNTWQPVQEKSFRAVVRGLVINTEVKDIEEAILAKGFNCKQIMQMISKNRTCPPLFRIELPDTPTNKKIFALTKLLSQKISIEPEHRQGAPICSRCLAFAHTHNNCHRQPRCGICGASNLMADCPKPPTDKPKYANCGGEHKALWKGCAAHQKFLSGIRGPIDQFQQQTQQNPNPPAQNQTQQPRNPRTQTQPQRPIIRNPQYPAWQTNPQNPDPPSTQPPRNPTQRSATREPPPPAPTNTPQETN